MHMHSISSPYFFIDVRVFKRIPNYVITSMRGCPDTLQKSQNIGFLSAILDPLKHHKSTKSAFDDGPLQWSMA